MGKIVYHNFNGLRGVAALAVMVCHISFRADWGEPAANGYLAVDLFFGLSGFVIAQAYGARLAGGMPLRQFAWLRLLRLYPLYLVGLLVGLVYFSAQGLAGVFQIAPLNMVAAVLTGILFLPLPVDLGGIPPVFPLDGPAWSLFFELYINLHYALALPLLTRRLLLCLLGLGALTLIPTGLWYGSLHVGWLPENFAGGFPRVLFSFCAGVLIFQLRPQPRASSVAALLVVMAGIALLCLGEKTWRYDLPVVLLAFPALLFAAAWFQPGPVVGAAFDRLGDISYAVYILHVPMLYVASSMITHARLDGFAGKSAWCVAMAVVVLASWLLTEFYDRPLRAWIGGRLGLSRPQPGAALPFRA